VGVGLGLAFDGISDNWRNGAGHWMIRDLSCPIGEFTGDKLEAETLHVSDGGGDGLVSNSDIAKEQGFGNARDKGRGHTNVDQATSDKVSVLLSERVCTLQNDRPGGFIEGIISSRKNSIHFFMHLVSRRRAQLGEEHRTCILVILVKQNLRGRRVSAGVEAIVRENSREGAEKGLMTGVTRPA
jgi:hypothetical protein